MTRPPVNWKFTRAERLQILVDALAWQDAGGTLGQFCETRGLSKNFLSRQIARPGMRAALAARGLGWHRRRRVDARALPETPAPDVAADKPAPPRKPRPRKPVDAALALRIDRELRRGRTFAQIAEDLGMQERRVRAIRKRALAEGVGTSLPVAARPIRAPAILVAFDEDMARRIDRDLHAGRSYAQIAADLGVKVWRVNDIRQKALVRGIGTRLAGGMKSRAGRLQRAAAAAATDAPAGAAEARAAHDAGNVLACAAWIDRRMHEGSLIGEVAAELGLAESRVNYLRARGFAAGIGSGLSTRAKKAASLRRRRMETLPPPPPLPEDTAIAKARLLRGAYARRDPQAALLGDPPPNFHRLRALFENPPARVALVAPVNAGRGEG